jgi:hypothetical protein
MTAILKFPKREQAIKFSIDWTRYSKKGHSISSGLENVEVSIYGFEEDGKKWIDNYVAEINESKT